MNELTLKLLVTGLVAIIQGPQKGEVTLVMPQVTSSDEILAHEAFLAYEPSAYEGVLGAVQGCDPGVEWEASLNSRPRSCVWSLERRSAGFKLDTSKGDLKLSNVVLDMPSLSKSAGQIDKSVFTGESPVVRGIFGGRFSSATVCNLLRESSDLWSGSVAEYWFAVGESIHHRQLVANSVLFEVTLPGDHLTLEIQGLDSEFRDTLMLRGNAEGEVHLLLRNAPYDERVFEMIEAGAIKRMNSLEHYISTYWSLMKTPQPIPSVAQSLEQSSDPWESPCSSPFSVSDQIDSPSMSPTAVLIEAEGESSIDWEKVRRKLRKLGVQPLSSVEAAQAIRLQGVGVLGGTYGPEYIPGPDDNPGIISPSPPPSRAGRIQDPSTFLRAFGPPICPVALFQMPAELIVEPGG